MQAEIRSGEITIMIIIIMLIILMMIILMIIILMIILIIINPFYGWMTCRGSISGGVALLLVGWAPRLSYTGQVTWTNCAKVVISSSVMCSTAA